MNRRRGQMKERDGEEKKMAGSRENEWINKTDGQIREKSEIIAQLIGVYVRGCSFFPVN